MHRTPREIVAKIHAVRESENRLSPFEMLKNRNFLVFIIYFLMFVGLIAGIVVVTGMASSPSIVILIVVSLIGFSWGLWLLFIFMMKAWFEPMTRRTNMAVALERCLSILEQDDAEETLIRELEELILERNRNEPGMLMKMLPFGKAETWRIKSAWVDAFSWVASPGNARNGHVSQPLERPPQ